MKSRVKEIKPMSVEGDKAYMQAAKRKFPLMAMTVVAAAMVTGTVLAGSTTNKGATPNGKPFVEIAGAIVEVEGQVAALQDQIDSLVGRVDSVEAEQAALVSAIADLEAQNLTLQAQIDANTDDIASIELQIAALEAENATLQAEIDALGDADGALQAQIDTNEASITALQLSVTTLAGDLQLSIDNNTALINAMQGEIEALTVEISMKQNVINGSCPNGNSIREILPDGSVICEFDDFGGGTTYLHAYRTYNYRYINPGTSATVTAYCGSGYIPISVGHHAYDMEVYDKISNPYPGSWGRNIIRNTSWYGRNGYTYVNCLRQN